jgi:hypothetical protein
MGYGEREERRWKQAQVRRIRKEYENERKRRRY